MDTLLLLAKVLLSAMFVGAGIMHFVKTEFFMGMMPPYIPFHKAGVLGSGVAEVIVGATLWITGLERWSAWAIVAMLIAFFPVHVYMIQASEKFAAIPKPALYARLLFQLVLVGVAYALT